MCESVMCDSLMCDSVLCDSVMCDSAMCDSNSVMCDCDSNSVMTSSCRGCRSQGWCGEGQRQGGEAAADRWDHSRVQTRLPRGGVLRQSHVPRPGRLPTQVWQFLLAVALKDTILQSVLHTMSVTSACRVSVCVISATNVTLPRLKRIYIGISNDGGGKCFRGTWVKLVEWDVGYLGRSSCVQASTAILVFRHIGRWGRPK